VKKLALVLVCCVFLPGCFRTVYVNLLPPNMPPAVETASTLDKKTRYGWQHFFIWGWVPEEITIDAAVLCGGEEHVARIETRQTFLQRLIEAFAGYYINVYAPYNGRVVCDHSER